MKPRPFFTVPSAATRPPSGRGGAPPAGREHHGGAPGEKAPKKAPSASRGSALGGGPEPPQDLAEVETTDELRFPTGMGELDRVLGGGAVRGSLVLVGGAPGIGKSTLMLQICDHLCRTAKVLYVSGEESEAADQAAGRAAPGAGGGLSLLSETNLENVVDAVHAVSPDVLIVDSIQTLYHGT